MKNVKITNGNLFRVDFDGHVFVFANNEDDARNIFDKNINDIAQDEIRFSDFSVEKVHSKLDINEDWLNALPYSDLEDDITCQEIFRIISERNDAIEIERLRKEYEEKNQLKLPL
jgi:hypothetical protein